MQRSSLKIFTAHYAYRNADLNLTPVTETTNGFINTNHQFINRIFLWYWPALAVKRWILYAFSFIYNTEQKTLVVTSHAFSREPKYKHRGNLFWGSFTNHNTANYMGHGINITTNQRLSPTFQGNGNTIFVGDSQTFALPIFPEGGGTSVHRLLDVLRSLS